jgi:hypothetical protein
MSMCIHRHDWIVSDVGSCIVIEIDDLQVANHFVELLQKDWKMLLFNALRWKDLWIN